ncbi:MAG: 3-coathanger stack domain-containing protein, partial [Thermoanaerobaculia bacterium]
YDAIWLDPRTGEETSIGAFPGGMSHVVNPPSTDDWVLLLTGASVPTKTLSIDPAPADGTVRSAPKGIDCGSDCLQDFEQGNEVELHEAPDYGFEFSNWGGDSDCWDGNVVMFFDTTCSADFAPCTDTSIVNLLLEETITDTRDFEACNELTAGAGTFVVGTTGDVLFRAGNRIILESGFEVESGGRFQARIGPQ